jgi:hypothetical protein
MSHYTWQWAFGRWRPTLTPAAVSPEAYQQVNYNYPQMLRESLWIFVDLCGSLWI